MDVEKKAKNQRLQWESRTKSVQKKRKPNQKHDGYLVKPGHEAGFFPRGNRAEKQKNTMDISHETGFFPHKNRF